MSRVRIKHFDESKKDKIFFFEDNNITMLSDMECGKPLRIIIKQNLKKVETSHAILSWYFWCLQGKVKQILGFTRKQRNAKRNLIVPFHICIKYYLQRFPYIRMLLIHFCIICIIYLSKEKNFNFLHAPFSHEQF